MTLVDLLAMGLRIAALIAALQASGIALFRGVFHALAGRSERAMARRTLAFVFMAIALAAIAHLFESARLAGAFSGVFDPSLHALLLGSDLGAVTGLRLLGLICIGSSCRLAGDAPAGIVVSSTGAALVAASFALMGHTAAHPQRWLLIVLLLVHLLVLAFWFGSLSALLIAARRESLAANARLIAAFSGLAVWLVPASLLAGLGIAAVLLGDWGALSSPYGLSLLAKLTGFCVLLMLAALNKWRFGPAIAAGRQQALLAFRRVVYVEWGLIAVVVAVTVLMTSQYSPD
jgi:putative copper export protein